MSKAISVLLGAVAVTNLVVAGAVAGSRSGVSQPVKDSKPVEALWSQPDREHVESIAGKFKSMIQERVNVAADNLVPVTVSDVQMVWTGPNTYVGMISFDCDDLDNVEASFYEDGNNMIYRMAADDMSRVVKCVFSKPVKGAVS